MKHAAFLKKAVALTLAILIGLSALSGVIMAFAVERYDYDYELEITEDTNVWVPAEDDQVLVALAEKLADTQVHFDFEEVATLTVKPGSKRNLWLGFSTDCNSRLQRLADQYHVSFDVLSFTFSPALGNPGTMTFSTPNPYLYWVKGDTLTPISSSYAEGLHTFETDALGCLVASNIEIKL